MITLQQLITIAPFPEETKEKLLTKSESFSPGKRIELEEMCWALISQSYHTELRFQEEMALMEMAEGKKSYTPEEMGAISTNLFQSLLKRLQVVEDQEDISKVREKLATLISSQTPTN